MLSPRENYLIAAHGGVPEYIPSFMDDGVGIFPTFWMDRDPVKDTDFCNIRWAVNDAGAMPDPAWRALDSISNWRDVIQFPDFSKMDWESLSEKEMERCSPDKVRIGMLNTAGIFLIPVNMLGWTDALCAIYEEPDELEEFVDALTDMLCALVPYEAKYYQPDIISTGDDIANTNGMFFGRDVWEGLYKPRFKRIIDVIHEEGALVEFHCCGDDNDVAEDLFEMGVDIFQLMPPNDRTLAFKRAHRGKLAMTGGLDRHGKGMLPDAPEEDVRQGVRDAIDLYGEGGGLIFWDGGIVGTSEDSKKKMAWTADELQKYGKRPA